jgi:hypothetical protein
VGRRVARGPSCRRAVVPSRWGGEQGRHAVKQGHRGVEKDGRRERQRPARTPLPQR